MEIKIQILQSGDDVFLDNLAPEVFDDPIIPNISQQFLADPRHHLAVALEGERVVGFASGVHYLHPDKPRPEFWINEVGVAPTHQGQGIGKDLLQALLAVAKGLGCAEAWVLTERDNLPAMRLYTALGGEEAPDEAVMFTFYLDQA